MSIKFLMQVKEFAKEYKTEIKDIKEIFYINEMFKQIGNKLYLIWHYDNTTIHTLHNKTWNVIEIIFKDNISRQLKNKIILHLHKTCKTNNWQLVVDKHSSSNLYYKCKFIYNPNYKMNSEDHTALLQSKFIESTNILRSYFNGSKLLLKIKQLAKNLNVKVDNIKDIIDFDNLAKRIAKLIYCIKYYYGIDSRKYLNGSAWNVISIKFKKNIPEKLQSKIIEFLLQQRNNWEILYDEKICKYIYKVNNEK